MSDQAAGVLVTVDIVIPRLSPSGFWMGSGTDPTKKTALSRLVGTSWGSSKHR